MRSLTYWSSYLDTLSRYDQRGQGVACGKGWISRDKKCSKGKAATTPKESLERTKQKAKERHALSKQVEEGRGKGATPKAPVHKKLFTEQEAEQYVAGSLWQDRTFYHGTTVGGGNAILRDGVQMERNIRGVYGRGFYMGSNTPNHDAFDIASEFSQGTVLEAKVKVNNPLRVTRREYLRLEAEALKEFRATNPDLEDEVPVPDITSRMIQKRGYDALEITDLGYVVVYDPKSVAIYDRHDSRDPTQPPPAPKDREQKRNKDISSSWKG